MKKKKERCPPDKLPCPKCKSVLTITCGHSGGIPSCWWCGHEIPDDYPDKTVWQWNEDLFEYQRIKKGP